MLFDNGLMNLYLSHVGKNSSIIQNIHELSDSGIIDITGDGNSLYITDESGSASVVRLFENKLSDDPDSVLFVGGIEKILSRPNVKRDPIMAMTSRGHLLSVEAMSSGYESEFNTPIYNNKNIV